MQGSAFIFLADPTAVINFLQTVSSNSAVIIQWIHGWAANRSEKENGGSSGTCQKEVDITKNLLHYQQLNNATEGTFVNTMDPRASNELASVPMNEPLKGVRYNSRAVFAQINCHGKDDVHQLWNIQFRVPCSRQEKHVEDTWHTYQRNHRNRHQKDRT
uniref:Uncharacterized protein n=1 Tax=Ascaris lumbricoides TaxID=6252 RepID=A0A9J2PB85_ASCLU